MLKKKMLIALGMAAVLSVGWIADASQSNLSWNFVDRCIVYCN